MIIPWYAFLDADIMINFYYYKVYQRFGMASLGSGVGWGGGIIIERE